MSGVVSSGTALSSACDRKETQDAVMKAFISYSHRDEPALKRLHAHLAMLRRDGSLAAWYDRDILAGGDINEEIEEQLEECDLFLALVSADFLNSDYCYEREMRRVMERHDATEVVIMPIIVEHCDWKNSPLGRFKAVPRDGNPISAWANEDEAYLDVVNDLRRLIQRKAPGRSAAQAAEPPPAVEKPLQYRVKRDFDAIDRADYRTAAFKEMQAFFEQSIIELDQVEGLRGRFQQMDATAFTCTVINRMRAAPGKAYITVRTSTVDRGMGDIYYSFTECGPENTANGWFNVEADDYERFLTWSNLMGGHDREGLSPHEAAAGLWGEYIRQAGVDNE